MTTSLEPPPRREVEASCSALADEEVPSDSGHAAIEVERLCAELTCARAQVANLQIALRTSRQIGMAMGIVMASRKVSGDQAFEILGTASRRRHQKLRDIAEEVLYTGDVDNF